ncbi:hypothetical protein BRC75_07700 [Halobacteriales archaeon QH_7_69_31]|nr:MAG: hypothetical protein BRC75_07700 [Halobacteriales archaeon QH_7_69_31]
MESRRLAPTLGVLASLAVVALLVLPYAILGSGEVGTYYGAGAVSPWLGGVLAALAVVVYAAGRERRTEPARAAGIGVGLGLALALVAVLWAVTVPSEVPLQLTTDRTVFGPLSTADILESHRWVLGVAAAAVPASGVWYARALGLV